MGRPPLFLQRLGDEALGGELHGLLKAAGDGQLPGLLEAVEEVLRLVAVAGDQDSPPQSAELPEEGGVGVGLGAIAPGHGSGVDLKEQIPAGQGVQGL